MKFKTLLFFILISGLLKAESKLPDSKVNLGFGGGMNYGIFGLKSVIGYKNSGLLLGLGFVPGGLLGYEIGAQYSDRWFFVNAGYGISGTIEYDMEKPETVKSGSVILGAMISLGEAKRTFLEIGIGHTFLTEKHYYMGMRLTDNAFIGIIGLGFRLGNRKE